MREFENHGVELTKAGITILPIAMSPAGQVLAEMTAFGVRTPYLIDATGSVSAAYGVLGKGMHAGLPGHGFVLIDSSGTERWYGPAPSIREQERVRNRTAAAVPGCRPADFT